MSNENKEEFRVDRWDADSEYIMRSFSLRKDLDEQLKKLERAYPMYTKKAIFNQLLAKALADYGYDKD